MRKKLENKILILGCFGYSNNLLDGQTMKTRSIHELLQMKINHSSQIRIYDTQQFKISKLSLLSMFYKVLWCNKLIYIPAHNNLKYLFPVIYLLCKLKRCEILYVVVGGWLTEYLRSKKFHVALLSNIKAILTQSDILSKALIKEYNFKNVITFPNFRIHSFTPSFPQNRDLFKIVFMARIEKMKGIDYIFHLGDYLIKQSFNGRPVVIDFYGQIEKDEEAYFYKKLSQYNNILYKGALQPDKIYKTLENYDLMVLPTRYPDEGFPGSILDAYISGLPVVATEWMYASEFIIHGKTGLIVPFENSEKEFVEAVIKIYQDDELQMKMKHNAYSQSIKYSSEEAWKILKQNNLL